MSDEKPGFTMGQSDLGVKCPECNCADMRVYRTIRHQDRIVRVRVCRHCVMGENFHLTPRDRVFVGETDDLERDGDALFHEN